MRTTTRPRLDARVGLAEVLGVLGRDLLEGTVPGPAVAVEGLAGIAGAVGATMVALVQLEMDGTAVAIQEWRQDRTSGRGVLDLAPLAPGQAAAHRWGAKLVAQLGVAGVSVVAVTRGGRDQWALVLGWSDRGRIWDEGWVPMLAAAGALLVGAERLAEAESRPSVDEYTGLANRKLFLVLAAHMLARLDRARGDGLAVLACQASSAAGAFPGDAVRALEVSGEAVCGPAPAAAAAVTLARRLEGHLREGDLVGRFDDDTIVVACEGVGTPEASLALARRVVTLLAPDPEGLPPEDAPAVHCGVVHTSVRVAPGVLLRRADTAAYQAAATGEGVALADL